MNRCINCKADLGSFHRHANKKHTHINGRRIVNVCNACAIYIEARMKKECFIEKYNGSYIYSIDGIKYVPYWGCSYYFTSLIGCRNRIDNKHIAIIG